MLDTVFSFRLSDEFVNKYNNTPSPWNKVKWVRKQHLFLNIAEICNNIFALLFKNGIHVFKNCVFNKKNGNI